jgi:hypothetical protein
VNCGNIKRGARRKMPAEIRMESMGGVGRGDKLERQSLGQNQGLASCMLAASSLADPHNPSQDRWTGVGECRDEC